MLPLDGDARTRLKVCCIASVEEARLACEAGADALGLVGRMPSGPGTIGDDQIARIAGWAPAGIATFLLTCETGPDAVVDHVRRTGVNTVQLVDDGIFPEVYSALRERAPGVRIVQVIHVRDGSAVGRALAAAPLVDMLLLDSGNPTARVRELGGTGRTHDWTISREIVDGAPTPTPRAVILAGGITPLNVGEAIRRVRPMAIDLCSGVRTNGRLDPAKLHALTAAMWG